ncbi:hypothetical protein [Catelliglobosispora koreensis]|uniref:hypothetical protein n=1 Tax=Catelliglobosispora koreensis TaxID=129052 RepID=UPI000367F55E|nr:hypothetical protein [Catelliglobosispora koreensis]
MGNTGVVRALAAWVVVVFAGIIELIALVDWALAAKSSDALHGILQVANPGIWLVLLLGAAVTLGGGVRPVIPGLRPLALLAFGEFGILLAWNAIYVAGVYSQQLSVESYPYERAASTGLMEPVFHTGVAVLAAVGVYFAWRLYVVNDPLAHEFDDLAGQLAELDDDEFDESAAQQGESADESYPR